MHSIPLPLQVLDDNKKLCLVSGEIIQLSSTMTMMFEVEDLAVASPATVSRCGMVYMEPTALGLQPLLDSWLGAGNAPAARTEHAPLLRAIFDALVPHLLQVLRRELKETVPTVDGNLCLSCFRIADALLATAADSASAAAADTEAAAATPPDGARGAAAAMLFAVVWSVGASCDKASRAAFDAAFRRQVLVSGCALLALAAHAALALLFCGLQISIISMCASV